MTNNANQSFARHLLHTVIALALATTLLACSGKREVADEHRKGVIELSDVADGKGGFVIYGTEYPDRLDFRIAGAGDVNGDGLDDVVVSEHYSELFNYGKVLGHDRGTGKCYVVFGKKDGTPVALSDIANGAGGFVINIVDGVERAGFSVVGAGDVNGDDFDDLIIRTYLISYVIFGKASGTAVELSSIESGIGGFTIKGIEFILDNTSAGLRGLITVAAGDVNGDGLVDLIAGLPYARPSKVVQAGGMYVVFGKTDGKPVELDEIARNSNTGGFVIHKLRGPGGYSGSGDVNGDGLDDLIIGVPSGEVGYPLHLNIGKSYVVFGKKTGTAVRLSIIAEDSSQGGFVINGCGNPARAGDVNGDGLDDVILDENWYQEQTIYQYYGESYVVFGKASGVAVELSEVATDDNTAGFRINQTNHQWMGRRTSAAGDVNGDGLDDLIVEDVEAYPEESYVVFGKSSGSAVKLTEIAMVDNAGGFRINKIPIDDRSFVRTSGAGDVNSDGLADFIVDLRTVDSSGQIWTGESYIVYGKANGMTVKLPDIAAGKGGYCIARRNLPKEDGIRRNHRGISSAGDVNGDGRDDIIVYDFDLATAYVVFSPTAGPKPTEDATAR